MSIRLLFYFLLLSTYPLLAQDIIVAKELKEIPIHSDTKIKTIKIGNYNGISSNFFQLTDGMHLITLIETNDTNLYLRNLTISVLSNFASLNDSIQVELLSVDQSTKEPNKVMIEFKGVLSDFLISKKKLGFELFRSYLKIPIGGYFVSIKYLPVSPNSILSLAFNQKNNKEVTYFKRARGNEWESVDFDDSKPYNLKTWFEVYVE